MRRGGPRAGKVSVIIGGGSGHYPAFCGTVGAGLADGAVIGDIFTSPSTEQAYRAGKALHGGAGVLFSFGNYAGDVMNFGVAQERLRAEGIDCRTVLVTDDVASAPAHQGNKRRGVVGDFVVFKIAGAAADRGDDLDRVEALARKANAATVSFGVAFAGCTFPGKTEPLFRVDAGHMDLGLGIHGEPGIRTVSWIPARELAAVLLEPLLAERPTSAARPVRAAVILNGLGATKYEELFVLWQTLGALFEEHGIEPVLPEVGEIVTSLDMAGCSLTLTWLDDELEELWVAPADTPAFRRGSVAELPRFEAVDRAGSEVLTGRFPAGRRNPRKPPHRPGRARSDAADYPGRRGRAGPDRRSGRGRRSRRRHGPRAPRSERRSRRGRSGPPEPVTYSVPQAQHGPTRQVGQAVCCGARFSPPSAANWATLTHRPGTPSSMPSPRVRMRCTGLGKCEVGDKTMYDSLRPFADSLRDNVSAGTPLIPAWRTQPGVAEQSAHDTATLTPRLGRARPLAERSIGTPDAGATSIAMIITLVGDVLADAVRHNETVSTVS